MDSKPAGSTPRRKMKLSRPYKKAQASLSFDAALALAYGLAVIGAHHTHTPQASSITRRALERYATWLGSLSDPELASEARRVAASSANHDPDPETELEALIRLEAVPLPSFHQVRFGCPPMDIEALDAKVEAMLATSPRYRMLSRKAAP